MIPNLKQAFPNLEAEGFQETSLATEKYNCIAWAAGITNKWWWPVPNGAYPWPEGVRGRLPWGPLSMPSLRWAIKPVKQPIWKPDLKKSPSFHWKASQRMLPGNFPMELGPANWASTLISLMDYKDWMVLCMENQLNS